MEVKQLVMDALALVKTKAICVFKRGFFDVFFFFEELKIEERENGNDAKGYEKKTVIE